MFKEAFSHKVVRLYSHNPQIYYRPCLPGA